MADRLWHAYIDALEAAIKHQRSWWAQCFKDIVMLRLQQDFDEKQARKQQEAQQQRQQQQQPIVIDLDPPTSPANESPPHSMHHP
eukprot:5496553-Amphidinium_carterae.1